MRTLVVLACLFGFLAAPVAHAAPAPDSTLVLGLQTCLSNDIESGIRVWYAQQPDLGAEMSGRVLGASRRLGTLIDTEVVAIQSISKRVTRYYVALYFTRSPLWIRIDRYESSAKTFFMPLKCATDPDDILPGYVTEFLANR
jgi:hypothetical protein